jgi:type II secretory pathway pseudopilin PulG
MNRKLSYKKGFGLLEIVVVSSIIAIVTIAIVGSLQSYIRVAQVGAQNSQALLLTEEGAEILQLFRDNGWTTNIAPLALNTPYSLYWDGSQYLATTTATIISGTYYRTVTFYPVNRDVNSNIASTGVLDPNTRKVTIRIQLATTTAPAILTTDLLIHNIYEN